MHKIENTIKDNGAKKVISITVSIGAFAGVEKDSFELCFPFAAANTVAEKASLIIEEVSLTLLCNSCKKEFATDMPFMVCTQCSSINVETIAGRDIKLKSIEVQ